MDDVLARISQQMSFRKRFADRAPMFLATAICLMLVWWVAQMPRVPAEEAAYSGVTGP